MTFFGINLNAIWQFRGFIFASIRREFKLRYQTSALGALWAVLHPLAMVLIYTIIFTQIMRAKLPGVENTLGYGIFLCSGILCWNTFLEIATRSQTIFLENSNLIRKMSFPRLCLPLIIWGSATINFIILLAIIVLALLVTGNDVGLTLVALIPLFILQTVFAGSLGLIIGVLQIFFRDVAQFFGIVFQFWFWLTPIVYPISILPDSIQPLIYINPLTSLVGAYQSVLVNGSWPNWLSLLPTTLLALMLAVTALLFYRARAIDMVDEL